MSNCGLTCLGKAGPVGMHLAGQEGEEPFDNEGTTKAPVRGACFCSQVLEGGGCTGLLIGIVRFDAKRLSVPAGELVAGAACPAFD